MFYLALVQANETTWSPAYKREDEEVFSFEIAQSEGDFASLTVDIKNPRSPSLEGGKPLWVWLTKDDIPLFFGRRVAIPQELHDNIVRIVFIARPADYDVKKQALADSMKVAPNFDPVFINDDRMDDPDTVLEGYSKLWAIDRVTHDLTASDVISGEDGTITMDDLFYDSLRVSFSAAPVTKVKVSAEVSWQQTAAGSLDVTKELYDAFGGRIRSLTGQGLHSDWPRDGTNLRGGWTIGEDYIVRIDGKATKRTTVEATIQPVADDQEDVDARTSSWLSPAEATVLPPYDVSFTVWEFAARLGVDYDVSRQKIEELYFELESDMQPIYTEPGDEEIIIFSVQSRRVTERIDGDIDSTAGGQMPIGDPSARSYFLTDRGKHSLGYLIAVARAKLLARSRAIEVSADFTFDFGIQFSCRKNCIIVDPRLPHGQAAGKIVGYSLNADGSGRQWSSVTIACATGKGNAVSSILGTPTYCEDDYETGYQFRSGANYVSGAGDVTFDDYSDTEIVDDGVDFDNIDASRDYLIKRMDVFNNWQTQRDVLRSKTFVDPAEAIEALNEVYTEVWMELEALQGGEPFVTEFKPQVSKLMVPRLVNLED